MQMRPMFDLAEVTAKAQQFENLLRRAEKSQKSGLRSSYNNAARGEEALLGGSTVETAEQEE
jgi:hypothetical protein